MKENIIQGTLIDYHIKGDKLSFVINGKEKIVATYYFKSIKERSNFDVSLGDTIRVEGELEEPHSNSNFNLFDYKQYLYQNDIFFLMKVKNIQQIKRNENIWYTIKETIVDRIQTLELMEYFSVFLLGNDNYFENDIQNSYKTNGLLHLFSVSGMHVSLISFSLLSLLQKCNVEMKRKYFLVFLFLMFYSFLTGYGSSILRSILFFLYAAINKIYYLKIKPIQLLFLTFSTLLIYRPYFLYDVGFQFSFVAVFFLLLTSRRLESFQNPIKKILFTTLLCFFSTLPFVLYYNYEIHLLSPLINLVFIPYITYLVFPIAILSFILPIFIPVLSIIIDILEWVSLYVSNMNPFILVLGKPEWIFFLFYYLLFTISLVKYRIYYFAILFLFCFLYFNMDLVDNSFKLTFIDVGTGDSILLEFPHNNHVVLVDTGGKMEYKKEEWKQYDKGNYSDYNVIPYLKSIGISKIDQLILTHGDMDHIGEAINLVNNFKVENIIFNCGEYNDLEKELIKVLEKKKIPYYSCIKELNINNNKLYFLNNKDYGNENDNSSVIYTELNNHKFLFMGDAGVEVEQNLIEKYNLQDIDVLKAGHHGSKTSSSKNFIDSINPKYSIISVGKNNRYGHPNKEVLDVLKNSKIYRTDQNGSIMFKIKNNKLQIETCTP